MFVLRLTHGPDANDLEEQARPSHHAQQTQVVEDGEGQTGSLGDTRANQEGSAEGASAQAIVAEIPVDQGLPLPLNTTLSPRDVESAISCFQAQHDNWLAIQSGSAHYTTKLRLIKDGEYINPEDYVSQSGLLEFAVTPLSIPEGSLSPAKVQVRMTNENTNWNFSRDNVFDKQEALKDWPEGPSDSAPPEKAFSQAKGAFMPQLFFYPFDYMAKSYPHAAWNNRYMDTSNRYFEDRGMPRRVSTPDETETLFHGEPQYLFMSSPALLDAQFWFSAESGELRQIDLLSHNTNTVISYRYENYTSETDDGPSFPRRCIATWRKGRGDSAVGWEMTYELTELQLNKQMLLSGPLPQRDTAMKQR